MIPRGAPRSSKGNDTADMTQTVDNPEVLRMEGITKRFPGVLANDDISIVVR